MTLEGFKNSGIHSLHNDFYTCFHNAHANNFSNDKSIHFISKGRHDDMAEQLQGVIMMTYRVYVRELVFPRECLWRIIVNKHVINCTCICMTRHIHHLLPIRKLKMRGISNSSNCAINGSIRQSSLLLLMTPNYWIYGLSQSLTAGLYTPRKMVYLLADSKIKMQRLLVNLCLNFVIIKQW